MLFAVVRVAVIDVLELALPTAVPSIARLEPVSAELDPSIASVPAAASAVLVPSITGPPDAAEDVKGVVLVELLVEWFTMEPRELNRAPANALFIEERPNTNRIAIGRSFFQEGTFPMTADFI